MHEISISQSILRSLKSELAPNDYQNLKTIKLKIGALAGIEPVLLHNAFKAVTLGTAQEDVTMEIDFLEVRAHCNNCHTKFTVLKHRYICPVCQTPSSNIIQGNELLVHQVEY